MSGKPRFTKEEIADHKKKTKRACYLKARESGRAWAFGNKEKANERWRKLPKEVRSEIHKKANAKRRLAHPNESKESMIAWRKIHHEEEKQKTRDFIRNNKRLAVEYLGGACKKCGGVFHPVAYEFHHVDESIKDSNISPLLRRKFSDIVGELDKCVLLCSNCHRVEHSQYDINGNHLGVGKLLSAEERSERRRQRYVKNREAMGKTVDSSLGRKGGRKPTRDVESDQYYRIRNKLRAIEYLGGCCSKCSGKFHPDVYDFHHVNGEKDNSVAKLLIRKFESIKVELDKCVLLCANCHRIEHAQY